MGWFELQILASWQVNYEVCDCFIPTKRQIPLISTFGKQSTVCKCIQWVKWCTRCHCNIFCLILDLKIIFHCMEYICNFLLYAQVYCATKQYDCSGVAECESRIVLTFSPVCCWRRESRWREGWYKYKVRRQASSRNWMIAQRCVSSYTGSQSGQIS